MPFDNYNTGKNKIDNNSKFTNKDRIYQFIKNNPGIHLRRIKNELGLAMGDIQYNLNMLERLGLVKYRKLSKYKHYYINSISGTRNESILAILQQETPRAIITRLIEHPGSSQKEIAKYLEFSTPTIKWHMSKLFEMNLICIHKERRLVKYYVKGDIIDIIALIKSYHPSLLVKLSNRLIDTFLDLSSGINISNKDEDNLIEKCHQIEYHKLFYNSIYKQKKDREKNI